jgi:hypothetical protein
MATALEMRAALVTHDREIIRHGESLGLDLIRC